MLTLLWRCGPDCGRRAGHFDRLIDDVELAKPWMVHRRRHLHMLHLGIGEDLIHRIDRPTGATGGVQVIDPIVGRLVLGDRIDRRIHLLPVLGAERACCE